MIHRQYTPTEIQLQAQIAIRNVWYHFCVPAYVNFARSGLFWNTFFYTHSTCSKPAYMIRSIVLLYNFRALCNDRNAHTKKTVLVILGMAFVTIDIHLIEQFECYLAKSIKFYIITVEIHLLFGSVYRKVRFFLSNTFHFDEKLKKIHANAYHDPYPCMWHL